MFKKKRILHGFYNKFVKFQMILVYILKILIFLARKYYSLLI